MPTRIYLKRRLWLIVIVISGLCTLTATATTIVIIRTKRHITIAADSDGTFVAEHGIITHKPVCKIFPVSNLHYAVQGVSYNPDSGFNLYEEINRLVKVEMTMRENVDVVTSSLRNKVQNEFEWEKKYRLEGLSEEVLRGEGAFTSVFFVGKQDGELLLIGQQFVAKSKDGESFSIEPVTITCPGDCPQPEFFLGKAGQYKRIIQYEKDHRGEVRPKSLARLEVARNLASKLVQLEIDAKSLGVEGPIDILQITNDGSVHWPQRKKMCDGFERKALIDKSVLPLKKKAVKK